MSAIGARHDVMPDDALARFRRVRKQTECLASGLSAEDCQLQSMPDASPVKWHLAHTSWFFETFLLHVYAPGYRAFDPAFAVLFNSYYVGVGDRHARAERGLVSRPSLAEVCDYRRHVDAAMAALIPLLDDEGTALLALGIAHEEQHQELILMDILHAFSRNPVFPAYDPAFPALPAAIGDAARVACPGGLYQVGHAGPGFAFDNETPMHRVWLEPFAIADRLVTNEDYTAFIADGGYQRPELWLSDGWARVQAEGWEAPLYWHRDGAQWRRFGLSGIAPVENAHPVTNVSYYEADAFARWSNARLPTEFEWETAEGLHDLQQAFDCAWQWTASAYLPYPGFAAAKGAVGEYNGKFMINQMVLRGGSLATPAGHSRPTYRNFFPPEARWLFSGLRLAWSV